MASEAVIYALNNLTITCRDGEIGYGTAAEKVKTPALKELFEQYARQRRLFATELSGLVRDLGGQPTDHASFTGTLQRGWLNIKTLVVGTDECDLIAECEHAEDIALRTYEEALKSNPPLNVQSVLLRQLDQVKEAHTRVHALEEVCTK